MVAVISKDAYRDYYISRHSFSFPPPIEPLRDETERIKKEIIESFSNGDLIFNLEEFLKSLNFHDQVLNQIFQTDMDSEDHLSIAVTLGSLIEKIESKIKNLRQGV
ncbi:hypothetical protein [Leptospira stimsonii]|uniref:hypothetical protein n=1 Tax=Leptospira stimsonii TaxID=2202203 RepID=UPI0010841503|nr:hypothetical protein [Leptospira stimsonii]TGK25395.1 hypothetical protein EHO98_03070 [Leptospira stimsonii]